MHMTAIRHDAAEGETKALSRVYVLILNWNGWADTIECLESVFRSDYPNFRVIVCDNASTNHSLELIKAWAEGNLNVLKPDNETICSLSHPPIPKPITYHEYSRTEAECGGSPTDSDCSLIFIQTGANLGFAGGCNVGLRYILARRDFDYVWLLNNDTVVGTQALQQLVVHALGQPSLGMCGSKVLYYDRPDVIQLLGGATYNKWLGMSRRVGGGRPDGAIVPTKEVVPKLSFISGASMLVTRQLMQDVGLMTEDYFLYYEEIDWATRARKHSRLSYCPESIVFHKEGRSIGSDSDKRKSSLTSEYYLKRNRLLFTRRYYAYCLPTVYLCMIAAIFDKIRIGRWDVARMILRLLVTGR